MPFGHCHDLPFTSSVALWSLSVLGLGGETRVEYMTWIYILSPKGWGATNSKERPMPTVAVLCAETVWDTGSMYMWICTGRYPDCTTQLMCGCWASRYDAFFARRSAIFLLLFLNWNTELCFEPESFVLFPLWNELPGVILLIKLLI